MVLDMFKIFIRSVESGISAVNKSSKCERELYYYYAHAILVFSSALLVALALQCSKIALVFLAGVFVSSSNIFTKYDRR